MKTIINFTIIILLCARIVSAQEWYLAGNAPGATDFLGSTSGNNQPVNIKNEDSQPIIFYTSAGSGTFNNQRVIITSGGNVGIGPASPGNLLHLNKTGAGDELYLQWTNGNTNYTGGMIMGVNTSNQGVINMKEQKPLRFYTDNLFRMEITGGGKVGIGTDAAQNLVHQHNSTNNSSTYHQFTTSSTGGTGSGNPTDGLTVGLTYDAAGTNAEFNLQESTGNMNFLTNATQRMTILTNGNVGIGVAAPKSLLHQHIASNGNTYHQYTNSNTGSSNATDGFTIGLTYASGVSHAELNNQETTGNIHFLTGGSATPKMTIQAAGNVGVGVTSPVFRLDVDNTSNSQNYTANFTNSASGYGNVNAGAVSLYNYLTRSTGVNDGMYFNIYGNTNWNRGLFGEVTADDCVLNVGAQLTVSRGSTNRGVVVMADNANNNVSTATENIGVISTGKDAATNYGLHGTASGSSATNYGVYGTASGGTTNYAGYFNGDVNRTGTDNFTSDSILKTNIQNLSNALSVINQLSPKTYSYKTEQQINSSIRLPQGTHAGLIAQDVLNVLPNLVANAVHPAEYDANDNLVHPALNYMTLNYVELIPYLIAGLNELKSQVDALQPNPVNGSGNQNRGNIPSQSILLEMEAGSRAILYQNEPNPFSDKTIIRYFVPETVNKASLVFYNSTGVQMKEVELLQKGTGQVEVEAGNISSGFYSYSLIIDGKETDTKRMVKMK